MIYTVKRIDEDLDFGCEERDKVCFDKNDPDFVISQIEAKNSGCSVFRMN